MAENEYSVMSLMFWKMIFKALWEKRFDDFAYASLCTYMFTERMGNEIINLVEEALILMQMSFKTFSYICLQRYSYFPYL